MDLISELLCLPSIDEVYRVMKEKDCTTKEAFYYLKRKNRENMLSIKED